MRCCRSVALGLKEKVKHGSVMLAEPLFLPEILKIIYDEIGYFLKKLLQSAKVYGIISYAIRVWRSW